jgi:hypothetical protein
MTRFSHILFSAAVATNVAFSRPLQFADAQKALGVRSVLQTTLSSADLETIQPQILEHATFTARGTSARYAQEIHDVATELANGTIDQATARLRLKETLDEIGYVPEFGEAGTIKDFRSDLRTNLVLEMNEGMAQGYGQWLQGQDSAILDQWPAQELYRAMEAQQPRDWKARWTAAGGQIFAGRMIALKNEEIWERISRFGTPYPPFDYGSKMDVRDIDRDTAIELGLIDRDTQIEPEDRGFADDLKFTPAVRDSALRQALLESDERLQFDGDVLTFKPGVY